MNWLRFKLGSTRMRLDAIERLRVQGGPNAVKTLIGAMKGQPIEVSIKAAEALGGLGDETASGALRDALNSERDQVLSLQCVLALSKLGDDSFPECITALIRQHGQATGRLFDRRPNHKAFLKLMLQAARASQGRSIALDMEEAVFYRGLDHKLIAYNCSFLNNLKWKPWKIENQITFAMLVDDYDLLEEPEWLQPAPHMIRQLAERFRYADKFPAHGRQRLLDVLQSTGSPHAVAALVEYLQEDGEKGLHSEVTLALESLAKQNALNAHIRNLLIYRSSVREGPIADFFKLMRRDEGRVRPDKGRGTSASDSPDGFHKSYIARDGSHIGIIGALDGQDHAWSMNLLSEPVGLVRALPVAEALDECRESTERRGQAPHGSLDDLWKSGHLGTPLSVIDRSSNRMISVQRETAMGQAYLIQSQNIDTGEMHRLACYQQSGSDDPSQPRGIAISFDGRWLAVVATWVNGDHSNLHVYELSSQSANKLDVHYVLANHDSIRSVYFLEDIVLTVQSVPYRASHSHWVVSSFLTLLGTRLNSCETPAGPSCQLVPMSSVDKFTLLLSSQYAISAVHIQT